MVGTPLVTVREARLPADGEAIAGLYRETVQWHAGQWPQDLRSLNDAVVRTLPELISPEENTFFRVAESAGAVVGLISASINPAPSGGMNRYDGPVVWVGDVVVTESARRQGVGGLLMAEVETWARARGACAITLSVHAGNDPALGLYERHGYRTTEHWLRKDL